MPHTIASVVGQRLATLRELEEYYSLEDAYNLMEAAHVEARNARAMTEKRPQ